MEKLVLLAEEGGTVLLIGMGIVFLFLIVMVFSMHAMGAIVGWLNKVFPEIKPEVAQKVCVKTTGHDEIAAVIAAIKARNY